MALTITPTNYGLVPYGTVSYVAYLSSQAPVTIVTTPLVVETLTNKFLPAIVKVYYSVNE